MGMDIQVCVEYLKELDDTETWFNGDNWRVNPYFQLEENEPEYDLVPVFDTRSSNLFELLSNPYNKDNVNTLGFSRGFPNETTKQTLAWANCFGDNVIAPSWATLKELKKGFELHPTSITKGFVYKEEAEAFRKDGIHPKSVFRGVSKNSDETEYEYIEIEWENLALKNLINALEKRKNELFYINPKNVGFDYDDKIRIVFFFEY